MRYREAGKPFKVYTLVYALTDWILTEVSYPAGTWRIRTFGDVIFLSHHEGSEPTSNTYEEALSRISNNATDTAIG